jgi:hypothetical protein
MLRPDPRLPANIRSPLLELAEGLDQIRRPLSPLALFSCAAADLPAPADWEGCILRISDLNILAHSDGTHWVRQDTGGAI